MESPDKAGTEDMTDISIALALGSLIIYGLTQVIAKAVVKNLDATSMVALNFLISIPIYVLLLGCAVIYWGEYVDHLGTPGVGGERDRGAAGSPALLARETERLRQVDAPLALIDPRGQLP